MAVHRPADAQALENVAGKSGRSASAAPERGAGPPCPVDRLPSRRRNLLCLRIILIGGLNFLAYTIAYAVIGGDAHNGDRRPVMMEGGGVRSGYFVRGHFIRSPTGMEREVSRSVWIYSYVHSISLFVTSAAMILSMLVLARPHILATMREGWMNGRTFVAVFGTLVVLIASAGVVLFTCDMIVQLTED